MCNHIFGWKEQKRFCHYHPIDENWGGRCSKCKRKFAIEFLDNPELCPQCKVKLTATWETWSEICCALCKETQIHKGILTTK